MDKIFETFRTDATIVQEFPKINRKIQLCKIEQSIFNKDAVLLSSFDATNEFTQRAEIKQRMRHHAAVINSIPQCIICFDRDGRITELNDAAEQLTGLIASNVVGTPEKQIFSFVSPRDNTPLPSPVAVVVQSGSGCERNTEIDLVLCNRNRISIRYKTNPIFNDKRHLDGVILIFQDETQSVRQQRNTEYRQKVLALAFEMTKAGYFTYSLKNRALIAGDGFERIWPRRDGLLLSETEWIYKDDLENFLAGREQLINGEKQLFEFTYRSNYFGKMCFYQLRAIRDLDESGEPAIFGVIQDISAINQIFSKHDDNSFVLQAIMKSLPCLFFIKDVSDDYRYLQASDAFCRFHNIKPETLIGKDDFDLFGDGRESSRMRSQDRQANRSNVPIEDYIDMTDRQNITHHFHVIRATHSNQYDRKLLFAIYFDQSEELKIQQNLKLERKFYLELLDRLPACVTVKNADDNFRYVTWNRLLEEHTGLAASAVIGKTDFEIAPYPGAQQAIRDEDMAAMATDEPIKTRTSFITASGKTIHYSNVKTVLR
ncbi:MAG: PAS domain-containing protein, partial [Victivallaceae bacterium]